VRVIRQNLGWAFGYNACGVVLAAGGWLHPAIAAVLMVLSSLAVIANSLRLRRFEAATSHQPEAQARDSSRIRQEFGRWGSVSSFSTPEFLASASRTLDGASKAATPHVEAET
jgi:hypothetical protein